MQSAILFLAVKVARVGPEYWVQPSPDSAVYLKWLIALILISRRGIEWLIALIFPFTGILAVYLKFNAISHGYSHSGNHYIRLRLSVLNLIWIGQPSHSGNHHIRATITLG